MVYPVSTSELAYNSTNINMIDDEDWRNSSLERMIELLDIEQSMLGYQLSKNGLMPAFKHLWQELEELYDLWNIPFKNRKKLLMKELEVVSLYLHDVLPFNYTEQGIWVVDEANGKWHKFLNKNDSIEVARAKWMALLGTDYKWFWDVYTDKINYYDLEEEDYVELYDLFVIIRFVNPEAI